MPTPSISGQVKQGMPLFGRRELTQYHLDNNSPSQLVSAMSYLLVSCPRSPQGREIMEGMKTSCPGLGTCAESHESDQGQQLDQALDSSLAVKMVQNRINPTACLPARHTALEVCVCNPQSRLRIAKHSRYELPRSGNIGDRRRPRRLRPASTHSS